MFPFGCVICQRLTRGGTSVDVYLDPDEISNLHPSFGRPFGHSGSTLAELIANTQDDAAAQPADDGENSVIACGNIVLQVPHPLPNNDIQPNQAWRIHPRSPNNSNPTKLPNTAEPRIVMESDWLYFLLRSGQDSARGSSSKKEHEHH
jgi:hypothetical protein